jgi:hypothetical protein
LSNCFSPTILKIRVYSREPVPACREFAAKLLLFRYVSPWPLFFPPCPLFFLRALCSSLRVLCPSLRGLCSSSLSSACTERGRMCVKVWVLFLLLLSVLIFPLKLFLRATPYTSREFPLFARRFFFAFQITRSPDLRITRFSIPQSALISRKSAAEFACFLIFCCRMSALLQAFRSWGKSL